MNKLIINKLRDAAHRWAVDQSREGVHICTVGSDYFLQLREDKFVELLIKECVSVARIADNGDEVYAWYAIQQHFGIKE